jgi:hypothetical protein
MMGSIRRACKAGAAERRAGWKICARLGVKYYWFVQKSNGNPVCAFDSVRSNSFLSGGTILTLILWLIPRGRSAGSDGLENTQ